MSEKERTKERLEILARGNEGIAVYMGYDTILWQDFWDGDERNDMMERLPYFIDKKYYKIGHDWYHRDQMNFHSSWDKLIPVVLEIYRRDGYMFNVNPTRASMVHTHVFHGLVRGDKILKYFNATRVVEDPADCLEILWELVVKFVSDEQAKSNGQGEVPQRGLQA